LATEFLLSGLQDQIEFRSKEDKRRLLNRSNKISGVAGIVGQIGIQISVVFLLAKMSTFCSSTKRGRLPTSVEPLRKKTGPVSPLSSKIRCSSTKTRS